MTTISFSPWMKWSVRDKYLKQLRGKMQSGVYLIARFNEVPPLGTAEPLDEIVLYIGESTKDRLADRWRSFDKTAFGKGGKHRGGIRYKKQYSSGSIPASSPLSRSTAPTIPSHPKEPQSCG